MDKANAVMNVRVLFFQFLILLDYDEKWGNITRNSFFGSNYYSARKAQGRG